MIAAQPEARSDDRPAIVFDFGGVLFRWHPPSMLRRVVPHLAHDEASAAHWVREIFQGYGGDWQAFDQGRVEVPDLVRRIARRTGAGEADVQAVVDAVPHELQPIEPAVALLARLKAAGRRLYFLSNMPAPYEMAIRQFGIDPQSTIYLDDLTANVEAARGAGLRAFRYDPAAHGDLLATLRAEGVQTV